VIYGGGPNPLCKSAVEVWNQYYIANTELLERSWSGASLEDLCEHRQRVVALRTMAVAYDAQTHTTPTRRQYFPSIPVHMPVLTPTGAPRPWLASALLQHPPTSAGWAAAQFHAGRIYYYTSTLALQSRFVFLVTLQCDALTDSAVGQSSLHWCRTY
jgi:hypothetical protein